MSRRTVNADDTRGHGDKCFYCPSKLGEPHGPRCVTVTRKAIVRMTVEYPVDVPDSWDQSGIEFYKNDSSSCASNAIAELDQLYGSVDGPCLCGRAKFEFVRFEDEP